MAVELPHDVSKYGPLRAAAEGRPELVRIAALIDALAVVQSLARCAAAAVVLDRIEAVRLYKLRAQGDALPVDASATFDLVWPGGPLAFVLGAQPTGRSPGPGGAFAAMAKHWAQEADADRSWADDECAWLAILRTDAQEAVPEVFEADTPEPAEPTAEVSQGPDLAALLATVDPVQARAAVNGAQPLWAQDGRRLVRVADVVDALKSTSHAPAHALQALMLAMVSRPELAPYTVQPDGEGHPVSPTRVWVKGVAAKPARSVLRDDWVQMGMVATQVPATKARARRVGLDGLLALLDGQAKKERRPLLNLLRDPLPAWCGPAGAYLALPLEGVAALFVGPPAVAMVVQPAADPLPIDLAPLPGFNSKRWQDKDRIRFLTVYHRAKAAGDKKEAALDRLAAAGWASAGATLAKRITEGSDALARSKGALAA